MEVFGNIVDGLPEILAFAIMIIANSGIPVFLGNLFKYIFPKMDGKTDVVVSWLTIALFAFVGIGQGYYDLDLLREIVPVYAANAKKLFEALTALIALIVALKANKPINDLVRNKVPFLGKSFSKK